MFSNTGSTGSNPETECSVGDIPASVILIVFLLAPVSPFVKNNSSAGAAVSNTSALAASLGIATCANTSSNNVLSTQDASNVPVISNTLLYASTAW